MTDCLLRDDYLDGRLTDAEAEAFEIHAADCDACDHAMALPPDIVRSLRAPTAPAALVDAAIRSARRAPDRAAVRTPYRRRLAVSLTAIAALALLVVVSGRIGKTSSEPTTAIAASAPPADQPAGAAPDSSQEAAPTESAPPPPLADASASQPAAAPRPAPVTRPATPSQTASREAPIPAGVAESPQVAESPDLGPDDTLAQSTPPADDPAAPADDEPTPE
ncbi:MAG: zf-HC2 domain-containing protein, partial [Bacteroidota bacterium]